MKDTEEKILCRSPFRSGRRSPIFARLINKGKVGVQRGRETAGVPSFLPPRRAPRRSRRPQTANPPAEVQRKTLRPERANTLTQFACPGQLVQKRRRPSGANTPAAVRVPRSAGTEKGATPLGRTRLRQFECPTQPVQRKEPPVRGEPACGSSCAPVIRCRKISRKFSKKLTIHGQFSPPSGIGLKEVTQ